MEITTEDEYENALSEVDKAFDEKIDPLSEKGLIISQLLIAIKDYEDKHYPFSILIIE